MRFGPTGGLQNFTTATGTLRGAEGPGRTRDLYLVFAEAGIYLDTLRLITGG